MDISNSNLENSGLNIMSLDLNLNYDDDKEKEENDFNTKMDSILKQLENQINNMKKYSNEKPGINIQDIDLTPNKKTFQDNNFSIFNENNIYNSNNENNNENELITINKYDFGRNAKKENEIPIDNEKVINIENKKEIYSSLNNSQDLGLSIQPKMNQEEENENKVNERKEKMNKKEEELERREKELLKKEKEFEERIKK